MGVWTYVFQVPPHQVRAFKSHFVGSAPAGRAYLSVMILRDKEVNRYILERC